MDPARKEVVVRPASLQRGRVRPGGDLGRWTAVAHALDAAQMSLPIFFGHHDPPDGNFIGDGERLWLIDWEYGAFGAAMFDLANLAANGRFTAADDRRLLEAYFEAPLTDPVQHSFDAMNGASALREATWALVSKTHLRAPGIDYRARADDFFARAKLALALFEGRPARSKPHTCSGSSSSSSSSSS